MRLPTFLRCRDRLLSVVLAAGLLGLPAALHADDLTAPVDEALKLAAERKAPVLIDFYAPWCYSCYFMAKNVKNGPEWDKLEKKAVVVELDADSPAGAYWMQQWTVKGLPSYVVLGADGKEIGRISLERTRAQFYPEIDAILARASGFDALKAVVTDGSAKSIGAARGVLQAFGARRDADGGLAWAKAQSPAVSDAIAKDPTASLWLSRLELIRANNAKDAEACAAVAPKVLSGPGSDTLGCDRAYELDRALSCTASLPAERRKTVFASQQAPMEALIAKRVLIKTPSCADARSVVSTTFDLATALGDTKAATSALDRAIADAEKRLGGPGKLDLKRDRNLADNLRVYLALAKRYDQLDALFPKLIAAWPDDYVYAYRFGRSLYERGQYEAALPWLEQSAPKAYGVNRLTVAEYRAMVLLKLNRAGDARQVVAEALKANGPFFPEQVAKLKALVA